MTIMLDFHQKRKVRSFIYHRNTLIVIGVIVLIIFHSTWSVYKKKRTSEEMMRVSAQRLAELQSRSEDLKMKIDRLETESGIEEEIRSRFSVVKEKENMVVIVPPEKNEAATTSQKQGIWSKIKGIFK